MHVVSITLLRYLLTSLLGNLDPSFLREKIVTNTALGLNDYILGIGYRL